MAVIINGDTGIDKITDGSVTTADLASTLDLSGKTMTYGNLPAANLSGSLPAIDGSNLTSIPAANLTGSLPAIDGSALTNLPAGGKILQVVTNNYTGTVGYNVNSWVNITQLATTITPSSTSSKIIVMGMINSSGYDHDFALYRNGSVISSAIGASPSSRAHSTFSTANAGDGGNDTINSHILYTDSPSSTSAQTYQIYVYPTNNFTLYINRSQDDSNNFNRPRTISHIILMEVGA